MGEDWSLGLVLDMTAFIPALAVLAVCWWVRPAFPGRLRPGSWTTLVGTLVIGLGLAALITWALLTYMERDATDPNLVRAIVLHALGFAGVLTTQPTGAPPFVTQVASTVVSITVILAVVLFTRSSRDNGTWTQDHELSLRELLRSHGDLDSLGYFATRRDKSVVFSRDGKAAVAYDVVAGVALAAGDPIGDPHSWDDAILRWKGQARWYGWAPAVLGASEDGARAYIADGFDVFALGDEAILRPDTYRLNNTSMTGVRRSVQRARRAGLTAKVRRQSEIPEVELVELVAMADAWRDGGTERGFSMALDRRGDPADRRTVWVTAHDASGKCYGMLSLVPWGATGLSLDTMRRHPEAPNGTNEFLVTSLMEAGGDLGIVKVSLNFAFLRGVFADAERLGAGVITRLNSSVLGGLDRFFQLERLYRANQKFEPQWVPRYVCLDSRLSLPRVLFAMGRAEGFLPTYFRRTQVPRVDEAHLAAIHELEARPAIDAASLAPRRGDQTQVRLDHAAALRAEGREPYPIGVAPAAPLGSVSGRSEEQWAGTVRLTGRVRAVRDHGGVAFADLVEGRDVVQVLLEAASTGPEHGPSAFVRSVDGGDVIVVDGRLGHSRNGTRAVLVDSWQIVAKALHPIPFGAFNDPETRLRRRETDLIVHPEAADMLRVRSAVVRSLRATLEGEGYLEVDTPILHTVHGGASARPFTTFSNAYGVDLSMRIAPELYLKRLVVAGLGPLFEIGRNFRNEGADATHNPEFTSLEAYEPFGDYTTMRLLTERLVKNAATAVHGSPVLPLRVREGSASWSTSPRRGRWSRCSARCPRRSAGRSISTPTSRSCSTSRAGTTCRSTRRWAPARSSRSSTPNSSSPTPCTRRSTSTSRWRPRR
ncbi:hypothetical protein GCM10025883_04500 [Mobilicoccus caccae]|uniref:Aminoacyl-transfer RNA synthetases class-II family profile domain-containing protein n=1 Tax=Mobilicoccus caccae TaxID=1859295 RepID=A0ABQ6IKK9_9MICO|nr:bifunctional lysylphosphatidylglycerol synthetase/lysine--tRNA ligase LysX [Mobilicoccus caccae]GMA38405.1 hypothetical protein GCM10025883_04500 [Mobilicoccus caccae]